MSDEEMMDGWIRDGMRAVRAFDSELRREAFRAAKRLAATLVQSPGGRRVARRLWLARIGHAAMKPTCSDVTP